MDRSTHIADYVSLYQNNPTRKSTVLRIDLEHIPSGPSFSGGGYRKAGYYLKAYLYDTFTEERLDPHNHNLKLLTQAKRFGPYQLEQLKHQLTRTPKHLSKNYVEYQNIYNTFLTLVTNKWPIVTEAT